MRFCHLGFGFAHDAPRSIRHDFLQIQDLVCWDGAEAELEKQKTVQSTSPSSS